MKKLILLLFIPLVFACSSDDEELPFYFADNGVTIKARSWVTVGTTANLNGETYTAVDFASLKEWINTGQDFSEEGMGKRILAWMIYLNDVTDGGHTAFPTQNKKFQPRRGDVLIWPAYFTHPHRGIVSKTQTKYIITGWYNFKEC